MSALSHAFASLPLMSAPVAELESWVLAYLLNSLWQIPLVFCAALAASRLARCGGPGMQHRIWVGALLLEAVLPACHLRLSELDRQVWGLLLWLRPNHAADGQTQVFINAGVASHLVLPGQIIRVLGVLAAVYACSLLYFAGRLGWGLWTTEAMRRQAVGLKLNPQAAGNIDRLERVFGLANGSVRLAASAGFHGPATVGVMRPTLLAPRGFIEKLSPTELDSLLAHEFAHMRRRDFAKNVLYGIISLPAAYHPAFWLTRKQLAETRELVCDTLAADAVGGREAYAGSLLRLASLLSDPARSAPRLLHAIGIFDANIFERRVMYLTRKSLEIQTPRRLAIIAACAVIACATCASALALRMDVADPSTQSTPSGPKTLNVKSESLTLEKKVTPVYPIQAKKDRVTGTVALAAIIGKDGAIENLRIVSGPSALQQSALDAVRQWRYQPFLLNGDPIQVKTTIKVMYTLAK